MLNNKNVSFKHTLEEYNKKYGNKNLKKISKVEVDKNPSLLNNKHWWFINDTYYQVTNSNKLISWWNALPQVAKIATCAVAGVGVVSAVVFPTLAATVWKNTTKLCTVTFDSDGGTPIAPIQAAYNTTIKEPDDKPTKNPTAQYTYEFKEWQLDGAKFDFGTPITSDITLKAAYTSKTAQYTVTFMNDGSTYETQTVDYGAKVTKPTNDPTKTDYEYNYTFKEWQLNGTTFDFNTSITSNITLNAAYNSVAWYKDAPYVASLTASDIGLLRGVTVNKKLHKVRLIDINKDKYDDGGEEKTAHTTWEFANIISDSEGYSLAYQWHDTNESSGENQDYPNSSIRKVLCGSGNFSSTVYCATKSSAHSSTASENSWDSTYTYTSTNNITIFSMLPTDLQNVLKTVKKTVRTGSDYTTSSNCSDKLFMLSTNEIGIGTATETKDDGVKYKYYEDHSTQNDRIKQQVNGSVGALDNSVKINSSGTAFQNDVSSRAGYNSTSTDKGGFYWLRSPASSNSKNAWYCIHDGRFSNYRVYDNAYGIAPAFCI